MFEQIGELAGRYEELGHRLNDPQMIANQILWQKTMREHAELKPLVETYQAYQEACRLEEDSLALLQEESDPELRQIAKEELSESREKKTQLEQKLKILLLPKDPNDEKDVFIEIRSGGG